MRKYLSMILNVSKYIIIYFLLQFLSGVIFAMTVSMWNNNIPKQQLSEVISKNIFVCTTISAIISFFIYVIILKNKEENLWKTCKFNKVNLKNIIYIIIASIGLSFITCSFVILTKDKFESYNKVTDILSTSLESIVGMICIIVLIPIFEEVLFRGLIFNELKKFINIYISIIIQALIFAALHGNLLQGIYTFILGVILAYIYMYTKSIWSNILMHIVFNLMSSLIVPMVLYYTKQYVYIYMLFGIGLVVFSLLNLYRKCYIKTELVINNI